MPALSDLTGRVFNHLTVIGLAPPRHTISGQSQVVWWCQCDCGHVRPVKATALRSGNTQSCGCIKNGRPHRCECILDDMGSTVWQLPEYGVWLAMRARCYNPKNIGYKNYGGRGITVHPSWNSFDQFFADVGQRPSPQHSLDRILTNGNYEPGNVQWSTRAIQSRNTRRNHWISHNDKTQVLADWAKDIGISVPRLLQRLKNRPTIEAALGAKQEVALIPFHNQLFTCAELAKAHHMLPTTLWRRLQRGLSVEEALATPIKGEHFLTYQGLTLSLTEWARRRNIPCVTLNARINRYGFSIERALTEPIHRPTRKK